MAAVAALSASPPFSALAAHSDPRASTALSTVSSLRSASNPVALSSYSSSPPPPLLPLAAPPLSPCCPEAGLRPAPRSHRSHDPPPPSKSEAFIIDLISLYTSAGMPDPAAAAFDRIPDILGQPCTVKSLSALLYAYLHNGRYGLVIETFDRAEKELNISSDKLCYNSLLKAFCKKGDMDNARNAFEEMLRKRIHPNILSLNALLSRYLTNDLAICEECLNSKSAPPFEAVKGLIDGLVKESRSGDAKDVASKDEDSNLHSILEINDTSVKGL